MYVDPAHTLVNMHKHYNLVKGQIILLGDHSEYFVIVLSEVMFGRKLYSNSSAETNTTAPSSGRNDTLHEDSQTSV